MTFLFASCSNYQKLLKKGTPEQKYQAALKFYDKEDYYHSQQLLDELIVLYRGTDRLELIYFYYAQTYYKQDEFIVAAYHFKYFARTFPKSQYAEEALFMSAYCKYLDSPPSNLDQTSTREALEDLQLFINTYPNSNKVPECNKLMDQLSFKLVQKDYENAKIHLTTEYYRSAIYALEQHVKEYPSSPFAEEALFLVVQANFEFAERSVDARKKERYTSAIKAYNDYIAKFSEGKHNKQARKIMLASQTKVKKY